MEKRAFPPLPTRPQPKAVYPALFPLLSLLLLILHIRLDTSIHQAFVLAIYMVQISHIFLCRFFHSIYSSANLYQTKMGDSNRNSEDETGPDDHPNSVCFCDNDKDRVKTLSAAIHQHLTNLLDSNPSFSSFLEVQLLSFQRELSLFVRRLFEARRQNSIKVPLKD